MVPPPPPASTKGSFLEHSHRRSHEPNEYSHSFSEKDAHQRGYSANERSSQWSRDSVISHPFSPKISSPPSPSSSVSSAPKRDRRRTKEIQEISHGNVTYPPRAHLDPEKQSVSPHSPRSPARVSTSNPDVTAQLYDQGEYIEVYPEKHAVWLLLYLSGPCALLSFVITVWTFISLAIVILIAPFRLLSKKGPFSDQLITFLAPPLNLQLSLIYSSSTATTYNAPLLLVIHLLSPMVAMGVAVAAWTAAFFWFFSAILGDPAGQDGHNDGRDSILGVRSWWDRWLSRALR